MAGEEWGAGAWGVGFVADGLLHSFPQLALSLWYYLNIVQTGLDYLNFLSIGATFLSALYLLGRGCRAARGGRASEGAGAMLLGGGGEEAKQRLLFSSAGPSEEERPVGMLN